MTALLLENLKLIMLFLLVGSIIGLSHFAGEAAGRTSGATSARKIAVMNVRLAAADRDTSFVPSGQLKPPFEPLFD